jgi:Arginase family
VPFDGGVTNRTGTRHGPREISNQSSLMRKVNQATRVAPFQLCSVADAESLDDFALLELGIVSWTVLAAHRRDRPRDQFGRRQQPSDLSEDRRSTSLAAIERTGQVSWPRRLAPRQT